MEKKNRNTVESLMDDFIDVDLLKHAMPSKAETRRSKKRLERLYSSLCPVAPVDVDNNTVGEIKEGRLDGDQPKNT